MRSSLGQNDGKAAESWTNRREVDEILPQLLASAASDGWDPAVIDFIKQTPRPVTDWQLKWRDTSYQWTSDGGRLLRIGDAAHTFLPTAGNGAVQGLEDGLSIAECLRIGGKQGVPWSTKVHNKLRCAPVLSRRRRLRLTTMPRASRFERTSILQEAGFLNREELHTYLQSVEAGAQNAYPGFFKLGRWTWGHNAELYATQSYHAALAHLRDGAPFANTNLPPGHRYEPWTLDKVMAQIRSGVPSKLKENGYWGLDPAYFRESAATAA
jgi:hypothetical protein